jgi:hypothetical protein
MDKKELAKHVNRVLREYMYDKQTSKGFIPDSYNHGVD